MFVAIYLGMSVFEILIASGQVEPPLGLIESAVSDNDPKVRDEMIASKRADAPGVAVFTMCVAAVYVFAAAVPRRPWAWMFSLVMICTTTFPFIVTAAGAIPLIIHWVKPEMKLHFNRGS